MGRISSLQQDHVEALVKEANRAYLIALRTCGSPSLADEAVQEAYVRLLQRPPKDQGHEKRLAYFLKMVRGIAIDLTRTTRNRKRREEAHAMSSKAPFASPEEAALNREVVEAARSALSTLPLEEREVVSLCCEQGLTQRVAGEIVGVAEQTVSDRVQRGLKKLRSLLVAQGYVAVGPMAVLALSDAMRASGVPPAPDTVVRAIEQIVSRSLASRSATLSSGTKAASSSISVLPIGALVFGVLAAGAWWAATSSPLHSLSASPSGKSPLLKPLSPASDSKILAHWDFSKGPAQDIQIESGTWVWRAGLDGEPGSMAAEKPVTLLLPALIPKRPVVVEVKALPIDREPYRQGNVGLSNARGPVAGRTWLKNWGRRITQEAPLKGAWQGYFLGGYSVQVVGDMLCGMIEYKEPFPGDHVSLNLNGWYVRSIEIRLLDPADVPEGFRDPKKLISGMEIGPIEAHESISDAIRKGKILRK